jgi:hypothetical protein
LIFGSVTLKAFCLGSPAALTEIRADARRHAGSRGGADYSGRCRRGASMSTVFRRRIGAVA